MIFAGLPLAPHRRNYCRRRLDIRCSRAVRIKLRWVEEHHAALAAGAEWSFIAGAGPAQHRDAVVAVKAAQSAALAALRARGL